MNIRNVASVSTGSWDTESGMRYYAIVVCDTMERFVHEVIFDCPDRLARFCQRVETRGFINLRYWGFHEFFSLTLEQRLNEEAYHEDLHRRGYSYLSNGVYSGGHV